MTIRRICITLLALLSLTAHSQAAEYAIDSGKGVNFFQLDFPADVPAVPNSSVGLLEANLIALRVNSGIPAGYVNVVRNGEWIVRNMVVPRERDYPYSHLSTEFNLQTAAGTDVTLMSAYAVYSDTVFQVAPTGGNPATFTVGNQTVNQTGSGDATGGRGAGASDPPDLTNILFAASQGLTRAFWQLDHPNQEAALNQCYPMAVANSLQFLENTTDLKLPHSHIPGLKGDTSLVGQLDLAMNRTAASRTSGSGVDDVPGINGKLKYLVQNGLQDRVQTRHWGKFAGATAGSFSEGGKSASSTAGGATIPFDEILGAIERGEDCEAAYSWPAGTNPDGSPKFGGHAIDLVAAGLTNGQPWIIESSDLDQGSDSDGAGAKGFRFNVLKDTNGNGYFNMNGSTKELDLLICQKYIAPPVTTGSGLPLIDQTYAAINADVMITKTTDPGGHSCCADAPPAGMTVTMDKGSLKLTGAASWLPITALLTGPNFLGVNTLQVAGFDGVANSIVGLMTATNVKTTITLGTNGRLPGGQPISWEVTITPKSPWPWLPAGKTNTGVKPRLRVNGFRDITVAKAFDPLAFSLSLDVDDQAGKPADYFFIAKQESTGLFFYYSLQSANWVPGVKPTFQGPLQNLPNTPLHTRMQGLPKGQYTFTFGVDTAVNGLIDPASMTSDIVTLVVQ